MNRLILTALTLLACFAPAQPAMAETAQTDTPETKPPVTKVPGEPAPNKPAPGKPAPNKQNPGSLTAPKLDEAFKNFTPSEEISADNAVPFPVDI